MCLRNIQQQEYNTSTTPLCVCKTLSANYQYYTKNIPVYIIVTFGDEKYLNC